MQEMHVQFLGQEDPLEKERATNLVFLPGKSQRSLVGYSPCAHQDFEDLLQDHTMHSFSLSPSPLLYAKPSSSILVSYYFWLLVIGSQTRYSGYFSLTEQKSQK